MLVSEHKADLNARANNNSTPLNEAAWYGQTNVVQCLINEFSCSTDTKGFQGENILHQACTTGNDEDYQSVDLIRYTPHLEDEDRENPHQFCGKEHTELAETSNESDTHCISRDEDAKEFKGILYVQ